MVHVAAILASLAILSSRVMAAPLPQGDGPAQEPGVRAPNGTPITDTVTTTTKMDDMNGKNTKMMEKPTTTSSPSYSTPMYGSGGNKWNAGYNDCVQQCMNTYGAPPAMYTPPPSTTTDGGNGGGMGGGGGGGKTHTVIVAPAQGILRFSPFAVNASVGDTIHFLWGASPHTVTRSSILLPCNKSTDPADTFTSGVQNKSFTFDLKVNTTDVITYYCGVPGHCPKGMFGFINPPNAAGTPMTVASMTPSMIANSSTLATQAMFVANKTAGTTAANWGGNLDMSNVPAEMQEQFIQNVWQTRLMFAANPGMMEGGMGAVNPSGSPVTVPADISQMTGNGDPNPNTNTGSGTSTSTTSAPAGVAGSSSSAAPSSTTTKSGGAMGKSVASSGALGIAVLVAFLVL